MYELAWECAIENSNTIPAKYNLVTSLILDRDFQSSFASQRHSITNGFLEQRFWIFKNELRILYGQIIHVNTEKNMNLETTVCFKNIFN